jgi:hypothetical protein
MTCVRDAVKAMVGIMHMKPAVIKLPKRLEGMMRDNATVQGERATDALAPDQRSAAFTAAAVCLWTRRPAWMLTRRRRTSVL